VRQTPTLRCIQEDRLTQQCCYLSEVTPCYLLVMMQLEGYILYQVCHWRLTPPLGDALQCG
jgi:hypothetical protein